MEKYGRHRINTGLRTHGRTGTVEHAAWQSMLGRCENPAKEKYPIYGGRGIKVCQRWRDSFEAFFSDMGEKPPGTTLDRIDVNGDYTPENCRWATHKQQARNRRSSHQIVYQGEALTVAELAERAGLHYSTMYDRILRFGWSVDDAMAKPARPMRSHVMKEAR